MPDSHEQQTLVTPEGVRDGDPAALSGLTTRRGSAVLAYAQRVASPERSVDAAAAALAWFRRAVVEAADPYAVDPERTLLRGARYAAAARAPRQLPLRARLRGGSAACQLVPELLAARAERELGPADRQRLGHHLDRCAGCRLAEERFRAGERAYRDAATAPPPPDVARAMMVALLAAAPNARTVGDTARPAAAQSATPEPAHAHPAGAPPADSAPAADPEPTGEAGRFEPEPTGDGQYRAARLRPVEEQSAADRPDGDALDRADDGLGRTMPFTPVDALDDPAHLGGEPDPFGHAASAVAPPPAPTIRVTQRAWPPATHGDAAMAVAEPLGEPAAHLVQERQPTYEFDALPADAFDVSGEPVSERRRSPLAVAAVILLVLVVAAALAVTAVAVLSAT
jgi:hypothetical protein